jgi:hypothetical protein
MRVLFASPTYGPTYPQAQRSIRQAIMVAARDTEWVDDVSFDRESWVNTRNFSLKRAQEYDRIDGILWCDDDMVVQPTTFANLIADNKDIVAALAFERKKPYRPGAWWSDPWRYITDYAAGLIQVDGVGFGTVYTSMKVLNAVGTFAHPPLQSEDRHFCDQARAKGFQVWIDTHNRVGHIAGHVIIDERISLMEQGRYSAAPGLPPDQNP